MVRSAGLGGTGLVSSTVVVGRRAGSSPRARRRAIAGYLWISPWLVGFLVFVLGPTLASFYLSFTRYNVISAPRFIGLENYIYALTRDPHFWDSILRTSYYVVLAAPVGVLISLGLALLLNAGRKGTTFYRTLFFLPGLTPVVASVLLWRWIFDTQIGPLNYLLESVGIPGPGWFGSSIWALPAMVIIALWASVGANRMVVFLAGLQGVPQELYEAAEVDGAGRLQRFWNITRPMISPTTFFNVVIGMIAAFKVFELAFLTTQGGPNYATWFYMLQLYRTAFEDFDMGYASALAWIFLLIILALTYAQIRWSDTWVYYEGSAKE
jgi:multiple sugar transport system permease protein